MLSVLINTNLLNASRINKVKKKSQYGEMESKQEVLCKLMIVLMELSKFFLVFFPSQ